MLTLVKRLIDKRTHIISMVYHINIIFISNLLIKIKHFKEISFFHSNYFYHQNYLDHYFIMLKISSVMSYQLNYKY